MNLKIWQIFFDALSFAKLDPGFTPYDNSASPHYMMENTAFVDIYCNKRDEWFNSDYTAALSWRFAEKTGFSAQDVQEQIKADGASKGVYLFTPPHNLNYFFPAFDKKQGEAIHALATYLDGKKLFDFKLCFMAKRPAASHCNYWVAHPLVFRDFMENVMLPALMFIQKDNEARRISHETVMHRGRPCPIMPFFLEGLFRRFIEATETEFEYIIHKKFLSGVNIPGRTVLYKEAEHELVSLQTDTLIN